MGREPGLLGGTRSVRPIAAGGEASVAFTRRDASLYPLQVPWQPSVAGPLELGIRGPSSVVVKGLAPGEGTLRIANLDDHFMDSITIEVAAIHSIPISFPRNELGSTIKHDLQSRTLALFAASPPLYMDLSLRSADGTALEDSAQSFQVISGGSLSRGFFEVYYSLQPAPSADVVRLEVQAGGDAHLVEVPIASRVDHIEHSTFRPAILDNKLRPRSASRPSPTSAASSAYRGPSPHLPA